MARVALAPVLLAALTLGCYDNMPEQDLNLRAGGLYLTSNPLSAPPGSLSEATNAVIRRRGVVEPRRGQAPDATVPNSAYAASMASFEGELILHTSANKLARRINSTTVTAYTGNFEAPTGSPVRFEEAEGGLYATTNTGPQRLDSPTGQWAAAGIPPGLEGSGATTGASGWLANGETVGYRYVWGARDGDGALMLGAPSSRFLVTNSSGGTRDVALTTFIPDGVVADVHFLQVYRTVLTTTGGADPGEDMAQVLEVFPNASELAAGTITVTDISSFPSGDAAYFNPSFGVGIAGAKEQPPLVTDLTVFNGYLFGVVQAYRQTLNLALLGVGTFPALDLGNGIEFTDGTDTETYTAGAAEAFPDIFLLSTAGTAAQDIEATARSFVRAVNSRDGGLLYAFYASGPADFPGKIVLVSRAVGGAAINANAIINAQAWTPRMPLELGVSAVSRAANVVTASFGGNPHGLSPGDTVELLNEYGVPADAALFPPGIKTIATVPNPDQFTYAEVGANGNNAGSMIYATTTEPVVFTQEATPGSYAFSDLNEPDAWPPRFRFQVNTGITLYRIVPQGQALIFFTSAGLYRLTGRSADEFVLLPMDGQTCILMAPNTAVGMSNRAFGLTDQGVISITDLGVEKLSEPLDAILLPYYGHGTNESQTILTSEAAFAIGYETENEYILFLQDPDAGTGDPANRAYTFNTQTGTWVGPWVWNWSGINTNGEVRSAHVHAGDGRLYIGAGERLTRERKNRSLPDYQDTTGVGFPVDVATVVNTQKNPAALKQWVEATVLLEKPQPASMELYFTTELDAAEEGATITSQGNAAVRTGIPRNKSRSARLTIGMRHEAAGEKMTVLGYAVTANTGSSRVGR